MSDGFNYISDDLKKGDIVAVATDHGNLQEFNDLLYVESVIWDSSEMIVNGRLMMHPTYSGVLTPVVFPYGVCVILFGGHYVA